MEAAEVYGDKRIWLGGSSVKSYLFGRSGQTLDEISIHSDNVPDKDQIFFLV